MKELKKTQDEKAFKATLPQVEQIGACQVSHGVHSEILPVVGKTVAQVRSMYADRFDIDPNAEAEINGKGADDTTVLKAGEMLVFANHSGEKGAEGLSEEAERLEKVGGLNA